MLLNTYYDALEISRQDKILIAKFLRPHRVVSTCRASGGMLEGMDYVYNHQACEPCNHHTGIPRSAYNDPAEYRRYVAERHGLSADKCVTLSTAANMHNAAICVERFRKHTVVAVATGGVESNGGRVGDFAGYYEEDGNHINLAEEERPEEGTINIMVFFSQELTPGALTRSIVTITEAKSSVLQELGAPSKYSNGLATGTGTDQVAAACLLTGAEPITGTGKHSKLGELIGRAVRGVVFETLKLQNHLTPQGQCSAWVHLERFGTDKDKLCNDVAEYLETDLAELWRNNYIEQDTDAPTVAAVAAFCHLADKLNWGVLPATCSPEIFSAYAANIAAAISGRYELTERFRQELAPSNMEFGDKELIELAAKSMAKGFEWKWKFYDNQ